MELPHCNTSWTVSMPDNTPFRHIRFPGQTSGASGLEHYINHMEDADVQAAPEDQPQQQAQGPLQAEAGANEEEIPIWIGGDPEDMTWIEFLLGIRHIWNTIKHDPALKPRYKRLKRIVLSWRMDVVEAGVEPYVDGHGYGHINEFGQYVREACPPDFIFQDMHLMARASRYWQELSFMIPTIQAFYNHLQEWLQWQQQQENEAPLVDAEITQVNRLIQLEYVFRSGQLLFERPWLQHWRNVIPWWMWAVDHDIPALPHIDDD